jgi:hypothetical protein
MDQITKKRLTTLAVLSAALLALAFGCDPEAGDKCDNPGSYSTRTKDGKRTNLSCRETGINPDGTPKHTWVKV